MKKVLELIELGDDSSFNLMVNPDLSDFFFWHFHPELELVYIEGANGTRNVGEHLSKYVYNDLVFIGSNIPHLNFDYGIKTKYQKIVIHVKPDFLQHAIKTSPELRPINDLFKKAEHGIAFGYKTKKQLAERIKNIHQLDNFDRFVEILKLFMHLGMTNDYELLSNEPIGWVFTRNDQDRLKRIYGFIESEFRRKIAVSEVAAISNLTNESFCRFFKKMTKLTFVEFLNHYRIDVAKKLLLQDKNISEVCFSTGFESLSYFNRTFKKVTRENPMAYKKRMFTES